MTADPSSVLVFLLIHQVLNYNPVLGAFLVGSCIVFMTFVVLNLFISVILVAFSQEQIHHQVTHPYREQNVHMWKKRDLTLEKQPHVTWYFLPICIIHCYCSRQRRMRLWTWCWWNSAVCLDLNVRNKMATASLRDLLFHLFQLMDFQQFPLEIFIRVKMIHFSDKHKQCFASVFACCT